MVDLSLLPAADERMRCADHARGLGVDPGGTAIRADVLIAVETPLPWPKPVFGHALLSDVPDMVAAAPQPTRVLAAVPVDADAGLAVVQYRRDPATGRVERSEWLADPETVRSTIESLIGGARPSLASMVHEDPPTAEVWVCTQGSHDTCCGSDGVRFANDIDGQWRDVVVRRVSHTGGHRFAPTAVTLPDGRMWAYLDPQGIDEVLRRAGDPARLAERCRGWWGAGVGPEQMAERAVLADQGWVWETAPRWTEVVHEDPDQQVVTVRVSVGEGALRRWLVRIGIAREVPTIACRTPGGLPAKPGREFEVLDLHAE